MSGPETKRLTVTIARETAGRINGHRHPITANEIAWVEFIRLASRDTDPPPTLEHVQGLRKLLSG